MGLTGRDQEVSRESLMHEGTLGQETKVVALEELHTFLDICG